MTSPIADFEKSRYLRRILDLLSPHERRRAYLLLGMVLMMALLETVGVASIMPFMATLANPGVIETNKYLAAAYETLGFTDPQKFLFFLGAVVFVALLTSIAFRALTTYALLRFTHMRNYSVGRRMVAGYLGQPYEWFLDRNSADLGKSVLSEVQQVIAGSVIPVMQAIAHGTVAVCLLLLLIAVDPVLASAVAVGLGVSYGAIYMGLRGYLARIGADRVRANQERFQAVQEAFGGIKAIKVGGLEGSSLHRFEGPSKRFARRQAALQIANQLPRFALEAVAFGGALAVALYLLASRGGLQQILPVMAVYALAGYKLMPALQQVYNQFANLKFAEPAVAALHADLMRFRASPNVEEVPPPAPLALSHGFALEKVSYTYPGAARPTLTGLDLEVGVRTTVGLVGATGSGKTTTVDLVLGLLEPQQGRLLVDGVPISPTSVPAWQRSIGYVPQHIFLTDGTIAANIGFGLPRAEIDMAAVERAAKIANLHEFVVQQLPARYETLVGERGVRLSGGQRQRIGIARALYHDPALLILDEATNSLDSVTEQAVMDAVHKLGRRKTIILIAHRLTAVRSCDQIFLLERGRVMAQGTFRELLEQSPSFRRMATGPSLA